MSPPSRPFKATQSVKQKLKVAGRVNCSKQRSQHFRDLPRTTASGCRRTTRLPICCKHRDGLKSAVVMTNGLSNEFAVAVKLKGQPTPIATWFKLQPGRPYGHFAYLVQAFEQTIRTGKAVYPAERTLLTTGVLDRVMQSLSQHGKQMETPELAVTYQAVDWPFANHPKSTLSLPNN